MRRLLPLVLLAACPSKDDAVDDDTDVPGDTDSGADADSDADTDVANDTDTDVADTDACGPVESFTLHAMDDDDLAPEIMVDDLLAVRTGPTGGAYIDLGFRAVGVPQLLRLTFGLHDEQGRSLLHEATTFQHVALAPLGGLGEPWSCEGEFRHLQLYPQVEEPTVDTGPDRWIVPFCDVRATLTLTLSAIDTADPSGARELATTTVSVELDPSHHGRSDDASDPCAAP